MEIELLEANSSLYPVELDDISDFDSQEVEPPPIENEKFVLWNGRYITPDAFFEEIENLAVNGDPKTKYKIQDLVERLIQAGAEGVSEEKRLLILRDIEVLSEKGRLKCAQKRGKIGHAAHKVAKFVKKHKVAIIVGIVVVVAIVAVVVVVGAGAGAAAGAGAGAGGAAGADGDDEKKQDDNDQNIISLDTPAENPTVEPVDDKNRPTIADSSATISTGKEDPFFKPTAPPFTMIPPPASVNPIAISPDWELPRIGDEDQGVIYIHCGINNSTNSANTSGDVVYNKLDQKFAIQPDLTYNDGLFQGLAMVALEKISQPSPVNALVQGPVLMAMEKVFLENSAVQESIFRQAEAMTIKAEEILKGNNPNLKQVHVGFSNGGYVLKEAVKLLPPAYQQTIIAITAGTTAVIDNASVCKVYNLIGTKDWPAQMCNGGEAGIERAADQADILPVKQIETQFPVGGHYFTQPEYLEEITNIIKNKVAKEYEVSK